MINPPLTINETQAGLIKKEFSAVELVDAYLDKINKSNKKINALITVSSDLAYGQARRIDKRLSEKDTSSTGSREILSNQPLLGATVIHKDLFLTKGIRTTAGSNVLRDYIPDYSATVVDRIDKAGGIVLGKANCDAWAHGSSGENSDFGPTKNPWNPDYVPGGSSSGSGAALAANLSLISTGTDTCGSIRLPANYTYLFGLKPTYGAVSRYGIVAMASSLDCPGPMARTTSDIEKVFQVIKGEDGYDSTVSQNLKLRTQNHNSKLKIGIPKEFFSRGLDKEIEKEIDKAIRIFEKEGVEFKEVSLPLTKYGISVYYIIQPAEVSSNLGRYDGIRYGYGRNFFGTEAKRRIMLGTYSLSAGYYDEFYKKATRVRSKIISEVNAVFEEVDVLMAPVAPTPPFKIGEKTNDPLKMYLTDIYAATANLTGIPSLAVPSGFTGNGLPLGFQLMASRFSEPTLFELGRRFERATDYKPKTAF